MRRSNKRLKLPSSSPAGGIWTTRARGCSAKEVVMKTWSYTSVSKGNRTRRGPRSKKCNYKLKRSRDRLMQHKEITSNQSSTKSQRGWWTRVNITPTTLAMKGVSFTCKRGKTKSRLYSNSSIPRYLPSAHSSHFKRQNKNRLIKSSREVSHSHKERGWPEDQSITQKSNKREFRSSRRISTGSTRTLRRWTKPKGLRVHSQLKTSWTRVIESGTCRNLRVIIKT